MLSYLPFILDVLCISLWKKEESVEKEHLVVLGYCLE